MRFIGICLIMAGVIYLIRGILFRNKIDEHSKKAIIMILNREEFLKIQLFFCIASSLYTILLGLLMIFSDIKIAYILVFLFIGAISQKLFIKISKFKGYIY